MPLLRRLGSIVRDPRRSVRPLDAGAGGREHPPPNSLSRAVIGWRYRTADNRDDRIAHLEALVEDLEIQVADLEMMQEVLLRLLAITHPLSTVLAQFGATATEERQLMKLLDDLTARVALETDRPSFDYFQTQVARIIPSLSNDRQFLRLLIDTLRVERVAYRGLYDYMIGQGWRSRI